MTHHATRRSLALAACSLAFLLAPTSPAAIPDAVPFQGRVAVDGTNFTGTGWFKFAVYEHPAGTFVPASATAVLTNGMVTAVSILSGGTGYSTGTTVVFVGGGGTATGTVTVNPATGAITGVTNLSSNSAFTAAPAVTFVDPAGPAQLWNNTAGATTAALAEPAAAVALPVVNGLYATGLGDVALPNMAALPASLIPAAGKHTFLRIWFSDGIQGYQTLAPDVALRSTPFAREAITAQSALNTASLGGVAFANFARRDTANTFDHVNGVTIQGAGPAGNPRGATIPVTGAGTRLEFIPGYSAFRAGTVSADQWDAANVGKYSTALGSDAIASGLFSISIGSTTTASGYNAAALGSSTVASAPYATAFGYSTTASGSTSTAFGAGTTASGDRSTTFGVGSTAGGAFSVAGGYFATAAGMSAVSLGAYTTAESAFETVLGRYNTDYTPASATAWNSADRLFVVGNGTSASARSDALVITKSGRTTFNGATSINDLAGLAVSGTGPNASSPATGATVPLVGAGTRFLFLPGYGALRAGTVSGTQWNASNLGVDSAAFGASTIASGYAAAAFGTDTQATGSAAFALGDQTTASGLNAFAAGSATQAIGTCSTALGNGTAADDYCGTVIGRYNQIDPIPSPTSWSSANRLFVIGNGTGPSARSNTLTVWASGDASLAGFIEASEFHTISDRNRKTDIVPVDTAAVLASVAGLPISTWRFKDKTAMHLGPMAQDFAAAFHLGEGDTTIATVDADGVALAAIQELTKRVTTLTDENNAKDARLAALEARLAAIEAKLR